MSLQVIDGGRLKEYMMIPGGNICPLLAFRGYRFAQPTATYRLSLTGKAWAIPSHLLTLRLFI